MRSCRHSFELRGFWTMYNSWFISDKYYYSQWFLGCSWICFNELLLLESSINSYHPTQYSDTQLPLSWMFNAVHINTLTDRMMDATRSGKEANQFIRLQTLGMCVAESELQKVVLERIMLTPPLVNKGKTKGWGLNSKVSFIELIRKCWKSPLEQKWTSFEKYVHRQKKNQKTFYIVLPN